MRLAYCFYLNTYRTDAFLETLSREADELLVLDVSPLRAVFRHQKLNRGEYLQRQRARLPSSTIYRLGPIIQCFPGKVGHGINFFLTLLATICFSLLLPWFLWRHRSERLLCYNGHVLFLPALLWVKLLQVPLYTDFGDLLYLVDNPNPLTRAVEIAFLRSSRRVISVSRQFKEYLQSRYHYPAEQISILSAAVPETFPTFFDKEENRKRRETLRQQLKAGDDDLVLVYSGGIWNKHIPGRGKVDVQGVYSLCEAFEILNNEGTCTRLILLGFSSDDPQFDRFRKGRWRERLIEYGQYRQGDERHLLCLGGADFLCLPSIRCETYHLYDRFKTYEYLAAGKRIIAADTPINRQILGDSGVYYQEEDPQSLADTVREHRKTCIDFLPEANRRVREKYLWRTRIDDGSITRALFGADPVELY